jgi:dinuclear metal center YbgI/SA1388 family protein
MAMALPATTLIDLLCKAAPEESAEAWDRSGLQCGDPDRPVESVILALDVRPSTLDAAVREGAGLIISHHPLIFEPLTRIDFRSSPGRELAQLIENRIALYVAHTNVDRSPTLSMNATIGQRLGLLSVECCAPAWQSAEMKLVTFVPLEAADKVRAALADAGAGQIGEYSNCSFNLPGTGTFHGSEAANPTIGERGRLERVEEVRLEMVCSKRGLDRALRALRESHPYEEVAYDLYPLAGYETQKHFLWKGNLESEMTLAEFARLVKESLGDGVAPIKYAGDPNRKVRRITWCSGSGKSLLPLLDPRETDAFLTGDTGHHDALKCLSGGIALVDLDHFYTERLFIENLRDYLYSRLPTGSVRMIADPAGPVYHSS